MASNNFIKYTLLFIVLVLLQVSVLNRISFFEYGTPLVYIYFILKLPIGTNRSLSTLLGFLLGFIIDIFSNTPGINASASTLIGFLNTPIQRGFFMKDENEDKIPSLSLFRGTFLKYAGLMILIHLIVLISLESFSYFNIELILFRIALSASLSFIIIFAFEGLSFKKKT